MSSAEPLHRLDSKVLLNALEKVKAKPEHVALLLANLLLKYFHSQPDESRFEKGEYFGHSPNNAELLVVYCFVYRELKNPLSEVRALTSKVHSQIIRHKIRNPEVELPDTVSDFELHGNWIELLEEASGSFDDWAERTNLPEEISENRNISPLNFYSKILFAYVNWLIKVARTEPNSKDISAFKSLVRELYPRWNG